MAGVSLSRRHGNAINGHRTPEYRSWYSAVGRCHNPGNHHYRNYGARGISVCERWRKSFPAFLADMGAKPSPRHSLDRIDNAGNYEPGNCRWATRKQQNNNKRTDHLLTLGGVTRNIQQWAEIKGINPKTLWHRVTTLGWTDEDALTKPVQPRRWANR